MKKYTLSLSIALLAFLFVGCTESTSTTPSEDEKQEEQNDNTNELKAPEFTLEVTSKPVLFDFTSTGCPGCGSWGGPTFESLISQEKNAIVPMAVHIKYGDKMITDASNAIAANRTGQFYTPQLWVNNTIGMVLSGGRINGTESLASLNSEIDAAQGRNPEIAVGISHASDEDNIAIRYKTKALTDLSGEYYVGIYVMENGINDRQSGNPNGSKDHNHVIRTTNSGGFGTMIAQENLALDAENQGEITFEIKDDWNMNNLYATIIVWKKEGNNYVVVNANNDLIL